MGRLSALLAATALLAGCQGPHHDPVGAPATSTVPLARASIGMATMKEDGTIVLNLRAEGPGILGDAQFVYPPSHPEYEKIRSHLGGLKPGEQKQVPPWQ